MPAILDALRTSVSYNLGDKKAAAPVSEDGRSARRENSSQGFRREVMAARRF